jgi:hypothetical protein
MNIILSGMALISSTKSSIFFVLTFPGYMAFTLQKSQSYLQPRENWRV